MWVRRKFKRLVVFAITLVSTALIEELALKTLFTPVGVTVFVVVACLAIAILWWPDIKRWATGGSLVLQARTPQPELLINDAETQRFQELTPLIEKLMTAYQPIPFIDSLRMFDLNFSNDDRELKFRLDELSIPYPDGTSAPEWSGYLRNLKLFSVEGRLAEARTFYRPESP